MSLFKNSSHFGTSQISILTFVFCFTIFQTAFSQNKIIFPWRAAPHIVEQGNTFELLLKHDGSVPIDSVILNGPYTRAVCEITSSTAGNFVYDQFTQEAANLKIRVAVPDGTPEDMYDLFVYAGDQESVSKRSLKVVRTFKSEYTLLHISDTHVSRNWTGTSDNGHAEELILMDKLVEVINIIGPDLVINTGDLIMDYTRFNPAPDGWGGSKVLGIKDKPYIDEKWNNYYEGAKGLKGIQAMNAPVFSLPGNHDFYGVTSDLDKSTQWNENCGLRVYGFSYGDTRYLMADDNLGDQNEYSNVFAPYLGNAGPGNLRIVGHHVGGKRDMNFLNTHSINLELYGHAHIPIEETIGTTPTISMRAGSATRTDWKNYDATGLYRIIWIDKGNITWSPALQFSTDPNKPHNEIENMLTLDYLSPTEVSIKNKYNIDLPAAKVRFVLPKGLYVPNIGYVEQSFDNDTSTIIDVRVDFAKQSTTNIRVTKK